MSPVDSVPEPQDIDEVEWLRAAATNPVFDFLNDPTEDVYSPTDGKPFVEGLIHD